MIVGEGWGFEKSPVEAKVTLAPSGGAGAVKYVSQLVNTVIKRQ